jgi:hypothetical protein
MDDAICYIRVSSEEQADSVLGLEAQRQRIAARQLRLAVLAMLMASLPSVFPVELLNAQSTSHAAGQATWPPDRLTLHWVHLAQLRQVGAAGMSLRK